MSEHYIGDGIYASFDGWQIKLRTPRENGDHEIYLEPDLMIALREYINATLAKFETAAINRAQET